MSQQMLTILLVALRFGASAGEAVAPSMAALQQDVEQDGETCLNALQVKAESKREIQPHVYQEAQAFSLRESATQYPPGCWVQYMSYMCQPRTTHDGGYDPFYTLDRAKYECALMGTGCVGVYMNPQGWAGGQAGHYYVCNSQPMTYEPAYPWEMVYFKGPNINSVYWSGYPHTCEMSAYPTPAPTPAPTPSIYNPGGIECGTYNPSRGANNAWPGSNNICPVGQSCSCYAPPATMTCCHWPY
jgi:hypothetical protein